MNCKMLTSASAENILLTKARLSSRISFNRQNSVFDSPLKSEDKLITNTTEMTQETKTKQMFTIRKIRHQLEPFQQYNMRIRDTLAQYQGINHQKLYKKGEVPVIQFNPPELSKNDKKLIERVYQSNSITKTPRIETNIHLESSNTNSIIFNNPYTSLRVLKQNNKIFSDINYDYLTRQQEKMSESLENAEEMTLKYRSKMPKIRVSPSIPRNFFEKKTALPDQYLINKKAAFEDIKLFAYFKYPNRNFPEGREQFALTLCENNILMIGGIGSTVHSNHIWSLDLEPLEWKKLEGVNTAPPCRFGHSATCHNNKVYVYGGRIKTSEYNGLVDMEIFNIETMTWITPKMPKTIMPPPLRRNHITELLGGHLFIHGGFSENNTVLNDCHILVISNMKWTSAIIHYDSVVPHLYGHTSCLVVPFEIRFSSRFNAYKYPDNKKKVNVRIMKETGIYIFGGMYKNEELSNDTYIATIGKPSIEWKKINTNGTKPLPRYLHSMNFYEKGNFIIIHGGRNDQLSTSFALTDTYLLNLINFDWMEVKLYSNTSEFQSIARCGHSALIYSKSLYFFLIKSLANKLIIFGGMNTNNYIGTSLFIINLDYYYVPTVTKEEVARKKLFSNYAVCMIDKHQMKKFQDLTTKNQLEIKSEFSLPAIK